MGLFILFSAPVYSAQAKSNQKIKDGYIRSSSGKIIRDPRRRLKKLLPWIDFTGAGIGGAGDEMGEGDVAGDDDGTGGDVHGGFASGGSGDGTGAGAGAGGNGGSAGGGSSSMDESASAGNKVDPGSRGDGGGGNKGGGQNGGDNPGMTGVTLQRWYAMCMFVDPQAPGDANAAIKKMVDDAARVCGVYIHVVPRTAKQGSFTPGNEAQINQLQRDKCNITEGLGIPAASTSFCSSDGDVAARMCGAYIPDGRGGQIPDPDVAGCGQVQKAGGAAINQQDFDSAGGGFSLPTASGGVATSIERQGDCTGDTVAHEALGHGQMGEPNGPRFGKGIGKPLPNDPQQNNGGGGEGSGSGDWTAAGCAAMNSNSFPNTRGFKWYPDKKLYYKMETNPERQFDMQGPYKVFNAPAGDPPPPGGGNPPPMTAVGPDNRVPASLQGNSGVSESPPASSGGGSGSIAQSGQADPHKKPTGGTGPLSRAPDADIESMMSRVDQALSFERATGGDPTEVKLQGQPNPISGAASTSVYGYNEDAQVGSSTNPLSTGSGPVDAGASSSSSSAGYSTGGGIASGDGISDGASTGANRGDDTRGGGGSGGGFASAGDTGSDPDSEFFKKKKKNRDRKDGWRRQRGGSLRSGGGTLRNPAQQGNLYQSGSVSFGD